uniref:Uncharacterized protein n=1 Tax=Wuchereria bancrofti TaxID=6293 RepID=A0A1I8ELQ6_WUCBA
MGSRQEQISIEQFHKLSLITPTEDKQISNKKEKPIIDAAITANKLRSGYSTSEQSNSQQMTYPHSAITDSGQFQFDDNGIDKETNTTKRLLFKSTIITESSSPSTISSAYSVTDEMSEINEEKMSNYDLNESYKSGSYETKKHERKEKLNYSEENRKHRKDDNICSMKCNKLNSGNILKYESISNSSANSRIIQTHVELIKRQAQREKRLLEEWNSAISDLEERCQLVSFERLKLLLHSNNYSYT